MALINGVTQPVSVSLVTQAYLIASQTLIPGGAAITISVTIVNLQTRGSSVVIGRKTEALSVLFGLSTTNVSLEGIIAMIGRHETPKPTISVPFLCSNVTGRLIWIELCPRMRTWLWKLRRSGPDLSFTKLWSKC